ncbi:hypothetical protein D3C85_1423350 [compost metagenome]
MGGGINCRHRYQNIDRVVVFVVKHQRCFQRHQREASFFDALFRATVRHGKARRNDEVRAVLRHAVENRLVVARLNHIGLNQQINAQFDSLLPGAGLGLQLDGTVFRQRIT